MLRNIVNNVINHSTCSSQKSNNTYSIIAKGDSGATNHYIRPQDSDILQDKVPTPQESVTQPDGTQMNIESVGRLPLHALLSAQATQGHVLRNLKSSSLLAMGPLCNDGCTVILTDKELAAVKQNKIVLQGWRNRRDGLWDIPLKKHTNCMENYKLPPQHSSVYIPFNQKARPPEHAPVITTTAHRKNTTSSSVVSLNVEQISQRMLNKMVDAQRRKDIKNRFNELQSPDLIKKNR